MQSYLPPGNEVLKGKIYYDTADSKKLVVRLKESNLFSCYDKINRGELNRCSFIILYLTQKTLVVASSCRSNNATRDHIEWRHLRMHRGWWLYWHTRKTLPSATLKMSSRRKEHHLPVKWNDRKVEVVCQWFSCAVTGLASYHVIPLLPHAASLQKRCLFLRLLGVWRRGRGDC